MGDCLFWAAIKTLQKKPTFLGLIITRLRLHFDFDKNALGYTLGDFFHKLIWSPCSVARFVYAATRVSKYFYHNQTFLIPHMLFE
jgi:hypothetical protein